MAEQYDKISTAVKSAGYFERFNVKTVLVVFCKAVLGFLQGGRDTITMRRAAAGIVLSES